jgi:hypothetical protein
MGVDIIGWRNCSLQEQLGPEGFLGKLKLRAYRRIVEEQIPEEKRAETKIKVKVTGKPDRELSYSEICKELGEFLKGIPECHTCPLSKNHQPLRCYYYISYPIDTLTEKLLFEFFTNQLDVPASESRWLYDEVFSQIDRETSFHTARGGSNESHTATLAELEQPLSFFWEEKGEKKSVDSAQLLTALFFYPHKDLIDYINFLVGFFSWLDAQNEPSLVTGQTLAEMRDYTELLQALAPYVTREGWSVVVDG